jgi:hypothetical protein
VTIGNSKHQSSIATSKVLIKVERESDQKSTVRGRPRFDSAQASASRLVQVRLLLLNLILF